MSNEREYHFAMRVRSSMVAAALAVLLVGAAFAQGVPASVTSFGFGGQAGSGVPASVTSQGFGSGPNVRIHNPFFNQPNCCINPLFPSNGDRGRGRRQQWSQQSSWGTVPYYTVPYTPVILVGQGDEYGEEPPPQEDAYRGGPTIFDRRGPGMQERPDLERMSRREESEDVEPAAKAEPVRAAEQPNTLLVFKDGHKIEVQNYAIIGDTLYDMTPGHSRKVLVADLDVAATVKQNDERGVDFRLPVMAKSSPKTTDKPHAN
jgi:hypothetical protein